MARSQFVPDQVLLLFLLVIGIPIAAFYTNQIAMMLVSMLIGSVLFVWKWRWWWDPLRAYVYPSEEVDQ